jgi:alpha-L-fucosidase
MALALVIALLCSIPPVLSAEPSGTPPPVVEQPDPVQGPFKPSWESLANYRVPNWFSEAKFGIWAHWGPQCVPEVGDWYARSMYESGSLQPDGSVKDVSRNYESHVKIYGHPSKVGFKDICYMWNPDKWDPEKLVDLYKRAGAQYFVAMANHHDNFDLWDSKYQPWNSLRFGPKRDLIAGWAKAARAEGLPFGVTVHAAHAWSWYEPAQGSDPAGPLAGVPYDGKLTKADGKGTWWDGLDPQTEFYAQNHPPGKNLVWDWDPAAGSSVPDAPYMLKFYKRTLDLIDTYHPDLLYFDDSVLPFHGVTDEVGLKIAAHFYNANMQWHNGRLEAVMTGKKLDEQQRKCLVWDIERGGAGKIEPLPWQTDTCIGDWHYNMGRACCNSYTSSFEVLQMLADVVSKNGNLLLNIPIRGNGSIDDLETARLEDIAAWMDINREAILATRPWKVFGESDHSGNTKGKSGKDQYSAADIRFTTKGDTLYAIALNWPRDGTVRVTSLAEGSHYYPGKIGKVEVLGAKAPATWKRTAEALEVNAGTESPCRGPVVVKVLP